MRFIRDVSLELELKEVARQERLFKAFATYLRDEEGINPEDLDSQEWEEWFEIFCYDLNDTPDGAAPWHGGRALVNYSSPWGD